MSSRRRVSALARLAGLYARHVARRVVAPHRDGEGRAAFERLYTPDRLTAITEAERAELPRHGLCIACGLCGLAAPRAGYARPERLPLQLTRSLPELWTARDLPLDEVDWVAAAAVCPTRVPLDGMRGFVDDRLRRDGTEPARPRVPGLRRRAESG